MSEHSEFSAALGVTINVPAAALGPAESKRVLDHCTGVLTGVATHYQGTVLDASGGNLSITFTAAHHAMQAAHAMCKRIGEMPPLASGTITVGIGAATNLGKAMALMLGANAGQIATDPEFEALLQPDTIVPEGFATALEVPASPATGQIETPPVTTEAAAEPAPAPETPAPANGSASKTRLVLTHQGKTVVIDDDNREARIGRGPECAMQINDPWASRVHATILKQGGRFVLLDSSTNGTFYATEDGIEAKLQKRPLTLGANGSFSLGRKAAQALGGAIRYEQQ